MEKILKKYSVFVLLAFFALSFFLIRGEAPVEVSAKYIKIAGQTMEVDVANTGAEHAQGLSGRKGLKENEGMLFVFDAPGTYKFWMKDMNFPIDMIWLDQNKKIVYIKKDARPESYPEAYGPSVPSLFVLEVTSGFSDKYKVKVGQKVEFDF